MIIDGCYGLSSRDVGLVSFLWSKLCMVIVFFFSKILIFHFLRD